MKTKLTLRVMTALMTVAMLLSMMPLSAFATIPNWEDNNVVFDGTSFGTNGYYNVISKKDYVLVPGAAVESEIVLNNADGTRRQVIHVIEVDPSNPDVSIIPGYHDIDVLAEEPTNEANWAHQELTEMAKYYENTLGYNIVGGMNTDLYYDTYAPRILVYNGQDLSVKGNTSPSSSILYVFKDAEGNISCDVKAFNRDDFNKYLADGTLLHAVSVSFAMVVKDGALVNTTEKRGTDDAARSMVGVKEDGTLVICMNDGRGANNSVGFSSYEEGEAMLALGCKWAANCDGGGSSTFLTKRVGEETFTMRSVPCDGAQRPTAHGIFVASNVGPTGELDVVNVESGYDIFAPNTVYTFGAEAIDTHGYAMAMPADVTWALSDATFGTIEDGNFVSNGTKGEVEVQVISGGNVVGSKSITVADPEVFKLSATSTVVPYSTADKVRTITLPIVAMIGEANVYVDTNAVAVTLSDAAAGTLNGFSFTATDDTTVTGVDVTVKYGETTLTYAIAFGKGSEVIFDFENGETAGFMGFEETRKWSLDNEVNNSLVASNPVGGQANTYLSSTTFTTTVANGGQVRNGNYALAWKLDNTDANFANWAYNILFNTGDTIVLRDVANGKLATSLGMWLYVPEEVFASAGKGMSFQSQFYTKNADGTYTHKQDHFMFTSAATGKQTNLNSATNADIPESRWVYASIDISKYDYLCVPVQADTGLRSPSFLRTYIKPEFPANITFYIDDITLDYSSAVDDRVLPVISEPTYSTSDTAVTLNNGTAITGNKVAFSAKVSDNAALNTATGKITVDGVAVKAAVSGGVLSSSEDVALTAGAHTVTFEISDELGNPAKLTRSFTITGDAVMELTGHNESGEAPKAQSVYYVDINVADLSKVTKLEVQLKLNNANTWETKGAVVANGFKADLSYNEVSELLTVTVELEDATKAKTADQTLVSIPVRVWTYDRFDYVTETAYDPAEYAGSTAMNKPVVNIDCEVVYGQVTLADKTVSPVGGSINVTTELTTITSPYHMHDAELTVLNKEATTTEIGYENRTYCETCKSVVDWGTIIPKVEITHNYQIVDGKFVCQDEGCGHVYESGTGVFEMNGDLYYSIAGKLVTGWQDADNGGKCFAYSSYKLAVGEQTVNGITYTFDENGSTMGAWVKDENGTKYSYGPDFYNCAAAASPYANIMWAEIDGKTYGFNKQGYRHEGINLIVGSNSDPVICEFTSDGVYVGEYETDHTGIFVCNAMTTYLENGKPVPAGLVKEGGYYYYINSGCYAVTGSYNVTRTNDLLPVGVYEFGPDGKMLNPPYVKHGIFDNCIYIDGVLQKAYRLVEFEGDYYFINNAKNEIARNISLYLSQQFVEGHNYPNGDPMLPGLYNFDEEGKMIILNGVVDGCYYVNGIQQRDWSLIEWDGNYYFNEYYKVAQNKQVYLSQQFVEGHNYPNGDPMLVGYYNFDADGKMIITNGVVDGYYYVNGIQQKTWELFAWEGNYYFNKYYNVAKSESVYLSQQFVEGFTYPNGDPMMVGYYNFDEDGKMIILNGVYDGLYYKNGIQQKTWELFVWEDNYYFNKYYNVAKSERVYLSQQFVEGFTYPNGDPMVVGYYNFDEDGKMIILNGVVDGYYYVNGIQQKTWELLEWEGNYYFNEYYRVSVNKQVYLSQQFVEGHYYPNGDPMLPGYYEFDAEGKMIIKNGPQDDGYFYVNGVRQSAYQLVKWEDDYYFINDGHKLAKNKMLYLKAEFLEGTSLKEWYYWFDADGKMIGYTEGIQNGRDIGKIPFLKTSDGKDIKEGLLFRGSELDGLETAIAAEEAKTGIDYLKNTFKVKLDMDLRSTNYAYMDVPDVLGESILHKYYGMVFYKEAFTDEGKQIVKEIFVDLANPDNYPIYLHCARGVDRAGTVCYILEALLGVPESYLANEFMISVGAYGNDILKVRDCINQYEGATLKDRTEAYLLDCGVTQEQINTIRDIFIED